MDASSPRYLLVSCASESEGLGRWHFVLQSLDGTDRLAAGDVEPGVGGDRLELLSVVRGLEALKQPSRVTLVTRSAYVREGIRYGLPEWRRNGWRWEWFGQMVPVSNEDLWRRVDRALEFHRIECRTLRMDSPHRLAGRSRRAWSGGGRRAPATVHLKRPFPLAIWLSGWLQWVSLAWRRIAKTAFRSVRGGATPALCRN